MCLKEWSKFVGLLVFHEGFNTKNDSEVRGERSQHGWSRREGGFPGDIGREMCWKRNGNISQEKISEGSHDENRPKCEQVQKFYEANLWGHLRCDTRVTFLLNVHM